MKRHVEGLVRRALNDAIAAGKLRAAEPPAFTVEVPSDPKYGDLSTNAALVLARAEGRPPRAIAETLVAHLATVTPAGWLVGPPEIAGPGFVNFRLAPAFWQARLQEALAQGEAYGRSDAGDGRRVQVEFVSANPTGPLTVGHGRNAVIGDTLARLLAAIGWTVEREYYFNNAGRQMSVLAASVRARYLELLGREAAFPEDGYQGEYIRDIARDLVARHGDALADAPALDPFRAAAEQAIFAVIRATQERLGIVFDRYFGEDSLYRSGAIQRTLDALDSRGLIVRRDGAVWLRAEATGLDQDRVVVKSSGEPAYRLPDIAYHLDKLARGYDLVVDVLGADHIAEHREVAAAVRALGHDPGRIRPVIYQFVTLTRHGEQVKMSTRRAEYVTLDELLDEVGVDAARFFFLMRKSDSHLEFDLDLAKQQSTDNPVFYVQYGHARIASVFRQAAEAGVEPLASPDLSPLGEPEVELLRVLATWPDVVEAAARDLEPHRVVFYALELAGAFHRYYNRHRILTEDGGLTQARLALVRAVQQVLRAALGLAGVAAPERM
ncbi:MAG TPA: arginine--tRNA ligase [Candidatus Binatia bacterium]|nr:arginine--tRNA ligase [Candidatus Binatia bacterium]